MEKCGRAFKVNEEVLFPATLEADGAKWFDKNNISHDHIGRHIFEESCRNVRIGRVSGAKCRRYSPLFIRLAIKLRDKLKNGFYSFLAKALGWPTSRTMSEYDSLGGNQTDGLVFESLAQMMEETSSIEANKDGDEWHRMVSLGFDAMHVADEIQSNMHSYEIVGINRNALESDVLLTELNELCEDDDDKPKKKKVNGQNKF